MKFNWPRVHTDGSAHAQRGRGWRERAAGGRCGCTPTEARTYRREARERERAGRGRQVRVLTDAHALCQRKLDAVIAGQTM